ncbi:MAG: class II fructose-bisphosphate aldolase [Elusimicrobiota bacterium]|nr:class II fructose-bisphosphate aldolase [Elusimicrobiota bacterium]
MVLVSTCSVLLDARKKCYAVPAFNCENLEMVQAIIEAGQEVSSPVIIQTTPSTLKYAPPATFFSIVSSLASKTSLPIAIHLDHGDSPSLCKTCIESGYTSVMIDGSNLGYDDNIKISKEVVDFALPKNIPVEAELGAVGGKEDSHSVDKKDAFFTDPSQALDFVNKTGIQTLAVAIGTAHGHYKETPKLDFERLASIAKIVEIPLVLHGTSGVADDDVVKCIALGISKVNYATELRDAYTKGVREVLSDKTVFDPKAYGRAGRKSVKDLAVYRMKLCKSAGKA